jgi:site-specific DNA recombinase
MTVPLRAALYLRVSTPRQAGHDLSIPDPEAAGRSVVENLAAACPQ